MILPTQSDVSERVALHSSSWSVSLPMMMGLKIVVPLVDQVVRWRREGRMSVRIGTGRAGRGCGLCRRQGSFCGEG